MRAQRAASTPNRALSLQSQKPRPRTIEHGTIVSMIAFVEQPNSNPAIAGDARSDYTRR